MQEMPRHSENVGFDCAMDYIQLSSLGALGDTDVIVAAWGTERGRVYSCYGEEMTMKYGCLLV